MTYSLDFRKHVFKVKEEEGLTWQRTSDHFSIPIRALFRWQARLEPCVKRNRVPYKIDIDALAQHIEDYPDAYQRERAAHFGVSKSGIYHALKRLKVRRKKKPSAPKGVRNKTYSLPS